MVNYHGIPDSVRGLASRLRPSMSESDLDTACRMYHQQNGDNWERDMGKDLKMRLQEQDMRREGRIRNDGSLADGYVETKDGRVD
jgi:hypothetical protein